MAMSAGRSEVVTIKVTGLEEIKRRLDELGNGRLARAMMRTGARKAAKVLLQGQQTTVPVREGKLRDSLGIQVKGAGTDTLRVLIGPDKSQNYIGRFHENGTKFMAGSHWMQRAFDSYSRQAMDAFTVEVTKLLDKKMYTELQAAIEAALNSEDE